MNVGPMMGTRDLLGQSGWFAEIRAQPLPVTSSPVLTGPHGPYTRKIASRCDQKKMGWLAKGRDGLKIRMGQKPCGGSIPPPGTITLAVLVTYCTLAFAPLLPARGFPQRSGLK